MSWWSPSLLEGPRPAPRAGHAVVAIDDTVVLTGGASREPKVLGDTWLLHTGQEPFRWEAISQNSEDERPSSSGVQTPAGSLDTRTGAASVAVGERVLVFGGYDPTTGAGFNDVASFEPGSRKWYSVQTNGTPPPPTHSHSACLVPPIDGSQAATVVLFGGATEEGCSNSLYVFNPESSTWHQPTTSGEPPSPREMHSAVMITPRKMLITGGRGPNGTVLSDAALLDVATWHWEPRGKLSEPAFPRCAHTLTRVGDGWRLYGGFTGEDVDGLLFDFNPDSLETSVISDAESAAAAATKTDSAIPPPRFAHTATCIPGPSSHERNGETAGSGHLLLIFGGVNPIEDLNDVVVWDQSREVVTSNGDGSEARMPLFLEEITT